MARTEEYPAAVQAHARARILIVEDNPLNRLLIHDLLELRGHEVLEAATVDEARAVLEAQRPDLLVLDVQIPGGGGEAIIREVRRRPDMAAESGEGARTPMTRVSREPTNRRRDAG